MRLSFLASSTKAVLHQMINIGASIQANDMPTGNTSCGMRLSPRTISSQYTQPNGTTQTLNNGANT
jgi:hypothetical protein